MNKRANSIWVVEVPKLTFGSFIILNLLAIFWYPGGTFINKDSSGYSMNLNFLSDLGRTISFSNENNFLSFILFNTALIITGITFIIFFIKVQKIFKEESSSNIITIGTIFGVLGGVAIAGVGFTPSDLYLNLHIVFATWLFRFFLIAALSYSIVIYKSAFINNKYALGYLVFAISILIYVLISEFGPSPKSSVFALNLQVISQKIILFIFLGAIYIQTLGIQKLRR